MKKNNTNNYPRLSIRLSYNERLNIEKRANDAGLSMGGYCKSVIFNTPPPRKSHRPSVDQIEIARLLSAVGSLGNNVNQIAHILNAGSSVPIPDIAKSLNDLAAIRSAIMRALGYQETAQDEKHRKGMQYNDYQSF